MPVGKKIKMYYDPRGNVIRTVNPPLEGYENTVKQAIGGESMHIGAAVTDRRWNFLKDVPVIQKMEITVEMLPLKPIENISSTPVLDTIPQVSNTVSNGGNNPQKKP